MALIKNFTTDTRINVTNAYHKVVRAEVRSMGSAQPAEFSEDEKDEEGNPVMTKPAVPAATLEVQVGTYVDKAAADEDAPMIGNRRFQLGAFDKNADVNPYVFIYTKLKELPEFENAADG